MPGQGPAAVTDPEQVRGSALVRVWAWDWVWVWVWDWVPGVAAVLGPEPVRAGLSV